MRIEKQTRFVLQDSEPILDGTDEGGEIQIFISAAPGQSYDAANSATGRLNLAAPP